MALHSSHADRRQAAGILWPDGSDARAAGNLRSALWRLRESGIRVIEADKICVAMRRDAVTDIQALNGWADRIIQGKAVNPDMHIPQLLAEAVNIIAGLV